MIETADVVIIGGGILGGSVAYHLVQRDPSLSVILLERDAEVGQGATSKATGGVRFQFSTETNVRLTQLSYPYFTDAPAIGRLMSEVVLDGRASSMDIGALSLDRFAGGRLSAEANMF